MQREVSFKTSRRRALFLLAMCILLVSASRYVIKGSPVIGWMGLILFGAGALLSMYLLVAGGPSLHLNQRGFEIRGAFNSTRVEWSRIESIELTDLPGSRMIVVNYKPADRLRRQPSASLTLGNIYDVSMDHLLETLKDWHAQYTASRTTIPVKAESAASPAERSLLQVIAERSRTDPLIGAKMGSKEITQRLMGAMKTERGVHVESLLCALGSLAGYACQAAIRARAVSQGKADAALLTVVETKDGGTYFFGDDLNRPLAEAEHSVWSIAAGGAQQAGCADLVDIDEIFKHVSSAVGTPAFGTPRIAERHAPQDSPINYVRTLWPALRPLIAKYCANPDHWPVLFSLSVQEVIANGRAVMDPCVALRLVMESAIPMSKVNLGAAA